MVGLCRYLHRSTIYDRRVGVQSHLIGVVPSHHTVQASMALDRLSWGCKAPGKGYPLEVLTVWVPG
jgi:hypothetical protein